MSEGRLAGLPEIRVDPAVAARLALGALALEGIEVAARRAAELDALVAAEVEAVRARLAATAAEGPARFEEARRLYRSFGIDPTRTRPSSEQLARRVARGDPFPRVNALVDAVNICQLEERLPYGLYDLDALEPPILARAGAPGEAYEGIRKGPVSLEGRPALFDARGPFGNPTSDSDRAKTTPATRRALVVIFAPPTIARARWEGILERTERRLLRHVSAVAAGRAIVKG